MSRDIVEHVGLFHMQLKVKMYVSLHSTKCATVTNKLYDWTLLISWLIFWNGRAKILASLYFRLEATYVHSLHSYTLCIYFKVNCRLFCWSWMGKPSDPRLRLGCCNRHPRLHERCWIVAVARGAEKKYRKLHLPSALLHRVNGMVRLVSGTTIL